MPTAAELGLDPGRLSLLYEYDAQKYLRSLPEEHFMESVAQATQRRITVLSFDQIATMRPDIQCFSELLIQYPIPGENPDRPARVVPDNMIVAHPVPIAAETSFMQPLQPVGPTLVLEYVSKSNPRKDYEDSYRKYEQLQVPYYLLFHADDETLRLFKMMHGQYLALVPDSLDRFAIPELELEVGVVDGWARFWFRGELLPLTAELLADLKLERGARLQAERRADAAEAKAEVAVAKANQAEAKANQAVAKANQAEAKANQAEAKASAVVAERDDAIRRAAVAEAELAALRAQFNTPK